MKTVGLQSHLTQMVQDWEGWPQKVTWLPMVLSDDPDFKRKFVKRWKESSPLGVLKPWLWNWIELKGRGKILAPTLGSCMALTDLHNLLSLKLCIRSPP